MAAIDRTTYNTQKNRKPFSKLKKDEKVAHYLQWIDNARDWRSEFVDCWELYYALYRHKHPHAKDGCDDYQVNKIFSTINVILSSTALEFPKITVEPRSADDAAAALIVERVVNYFWDVFEYQDAVRTAYKDSLIIGHGWIKTHWRFEEEEDDTASDPATLDGDLFGPERDRLASQPVTLDGELAQRGQTDEERQRTEALGNKFVLRDEPVVSRVSPYDMFVDPEARDIKDIRWIAQRTRYTYDELVERGKIPKKEGGFRRSAVEDAYEDDREDLEHRTFPTMDVPESCEYWVTVWEFYDIARNEMSVFADGGKEFLLDPMPIPYAFGHPFVYVGNHEVTEELYDMGDVEALSDLQSELNQTRSDIVNHRRRYRVKHWYRESLGEDFLKVMTSNEEDLWAPIPDDVDSQDLIGVIPQIQTPPELYNQSVLISQDIDEISGVSDFQRGRATGGGTATEAAIQNSAAQARASEKLRRLERVMGRVARNVVQLAQDFMESDHVVRITGIQNELQLQEGSRFQQRGTTLFIDVDRELISGEFDFKVEAGSTQPLNEALRNQRAIQMLTMLTPFAAQGLVNVQELLTWALEQMGIVGSVERFLTPQAQDPQAALGLGQAGTPAGGAPPQTPQTGVDNQIGGIQDQNIDPRIVQQLQQQVGLEL